MKDQLRPAVGAGYRFGVEAAIADIAILTFAGGTQFEASHGGVRPVIRQSFDQRVSRAALGTVDKRVTVTPVCRGIEFGQAVVTDEIIRRQVDIGITAGVTGENLEAVAQ
jgi:hypothetical protein